MWTILILCMVHYPCTGCTLPISPHTTTDTILLAEKKITPGWNIVNSVVACDSITGNRYDKRLRTWLLLDDARVQVNPEGALELYLIDQPPVVTKLSASQPAFVTVLDLYSLTIPGRKNQLAIDITERIGKLFPGNQQLGTVYAAIKFGPVKIADGSYSDKTGDLRIARVRIVQTKE